MKDVEDFVEKLLDQKQLTGEEREKYRAALLKTFRAIEAVSLFGDPQARYDFGC